jgi:cellulose synthase/poly-beta-1,6-N-acetylglucosamine synthase-like glycosyltransferase
MAPMFLLTLLGCSLFAVYGVLIDYYRRAWAAIPPFAYPAAGGKACRTKISVLVPARNEAANIAACVEALARQSYPKDLYQVIVIDDHSTDGTWDILQGLNYPDLSKLWLRLTDEGAAATTATGVAAAVAQVLAAGPVRAYKKFAIETGIRMASGELIVTTDADCLFDPDWLSTLAAFYEEKGAKFIAAPVRIGAGRRSFLTIFQTLDFLTLQGITGAAVYKKIHSMCNGANLAYEKKAFYEVEGFKGIDAIPSGDDMLLMHKIYLKYPEKVFFLKSPRAIVSTRPETRWKGFVNQRVRWASKADRYDDKRIFWVLLLVYLVNALFVALLFAACWNRWWGWLLLVGLMAKTIVEYPFVRMVAAFFGQQRLMVYFPVMQPFHIVYTVVVGWMGKFGSYHWKDRKISK